jgi:hypothetical protein
MTNPLLFLYLATAIALAAQPLPKPVLVDVGEHGYLAITGVYLLSDSFGDDGKFSFVVDSHVSSTSPTKITLLFEVGGLCNGGERRQWTITAQISEMTGYNNPYDSHTVPVKRVAGCTHEIIRAHLVRAVCHGFAPGAFVESDIFVVEGEPFTKADFTEQLDAVRARRAAEAAEEVEFRAISDRAKTAELSKLTASCHAVHQKTIDKPTGQITVREMEQISICRQAFLYK